MYLNYLRTKNSKIFVLYIKIYSKIKIDPLIKIVNGSLVDLPTPNNIRVMWNFGSLLGLCLISQLITGLLLAIPGVSLGLVLLAWSIYPLKFRGLCFRFSIIFIIIILRLNIYPVLLIGWGSDNKYSIMGALRGVAQTISYEISFALIILITILYLKDMSIDRMQLRKEYQRLIIISPSILILWVISALAETNRTPFDFAEGESELVSGFNTEFRAWGFATIFMAEYGRIYFLRAITASLFFPSSHAIIIAVFATLIVCFWVWARTTFPRYRYDLLINLAWKRILPTVLRLSLIIVRISLI